MSEDEERDLYHTLQRIGVELSQLSETYSQFSDLLLDKLHAQNARIESLEKEKADKDKRDKVYVIVNTILHFLYPLSVIAIAYFFSKLYNK